MNPRQQLDFYLRHNLYAFLELAFGQLHPGKPFVPTSHIEAMCWQLQRVAAGQCNRLVITVPPRHLKSVTVAVAFVAWLLGRNPALKILVASYGSDLAAKHARDFRAVIEMADFRRLFPQFAIDPARDAAMEMMTTLRGGRKAVSVGGATTGFGADIIIIDDLLKADEARSEAGRERAKIFFDETLFTRLDDKQNGIIIAIQQRLHEDDPAGHLLAKGFEHLNLPAIAEELQELPLYYSKTFIRKPGDVLAPLLESRAELEAMRRTMGAAAFSAQYQQNPTPPGGNRIRWEWFGTWHEPRPRDWYQYVVQSWDTALTGQPTSDYSVCLTLGFREGYWHLLDVDRRRLDYPDLKRRVVALAKQWDPNTIIVEDAASGRPLVQELKRHVWPDDRGRIWAYSPRLDKETRVEVQSAKLEQGLVLLPSEAPWLTAFRSELLGFPNARYDDQVDSLTQFLEWAESRRGRLWRETDPVTGRPLGRRRPQGRPLKRQAA